MKKNQINLKASVFLLTTALLLSSSAFAIENKSLSSVKSNNNDQVSDLKEKDVELNINNENKLKINVTEPVKQLDGQLFKSKEELLGQYFQVQKKMDVEDIKFLWEATVDRNPIIKFALKKLAMPPEQRRVHSSRMAKTVGALISGVAILPGMFGADSITSSASSAAGTLANRLIASKEKARELPLTDTELIHLAALVHDLQDRVIKNYYEYKSDLESLKLAQKEVIKHQIAYSVALRVNEPLAILTSKVMYDNAIKDEMNLKRKVKINSLQLERLAGAESLNNLKLGKILTSENTEVLTGLLPPLPKGTLLAKLPPVPAITTSIFKDKTVNELAQEATKELNGDRTDMLSDLNILWNAAVGRSETIRFAILKLSNPDGNIEKASAVKNILSPLAGVATLIGTGFSDPVTASSAMLGGSLFNSLFSDDKALLNAKLSKVTDTDLVLLAQETDNLQQKLVTLYCNYTAALAELNFVDKVAENRKSYYESAVQKNLPELKTVSDMFYKESLADQYKSRQNFLGTRVELEQFVGNEALLSVDKNIKQRLSLH